MSDVTALLQQLAVFNEAFEKAVRSQRNRGRWITEWEGASDRIRQCLKDQHVRQELDELLQMLSERLAQPNVEAITREVVHHQLAAFVKAESQLHRLTHIKSTLYYEVVSEVAPTLTSAHHAAFPGNASEFLTEFEQACEKAGAALKATLDLPRKQKKIIKRNSAAIIAKYAIGTLITVSNVWYAAHQPIFPTMIGLGSMEVGARFFGLRIALMKKVPSKVTVASKKSSKAGG